MNNYLWNDPWETKIRGKYKRTNNHLFLIWKVKCRGNFFRCIVELKKAMLKMVVLYIKKYIYIYLRQGFLTVNCRVFIYK